jgi:FixJ family two-component response regulator
MQNDSCICLLITNHPEVRGTIASSIQKAACNSIKDCETIESIAHSKGDSQQPRIFLLDVVHDDDETASKKVNHLMETKGAGPVVVIGMNRSGSLLAHWFRNGVIDYLDWPLNQEQLKQSIDLCQLSIQKMVILRDEYRSLLERRKSITEREEDVLDMVIQGIPNKLIATKLSVSQRTIEARRHRIYQKMHANKLVDLIRSLARLEWLGIELHRKRMLDDTPAADEVSRDRSKET